MHICFEGRGRGVRQEKWWFQPEHTRQENCSLSGSVKPALALLPVPRRAEQVGKLFSIKTQSNLFSRYFLFQEEQKNLSNQSNPTQFQPEHNRQENCSLSGAVQPVLALLPVPRRAEQSGKLFSTLSPTCSRVTSCSKKSRTDRKIVLHKIQSNLFSRNFLLQEEQNR